MAAENVYEFTDGNFETEVLGAEVPVLVDFWAEWCMPCRMLAPTVEKIATEYGEKIKVGKVDTDSNRTTAVTYQIQSIPTIILFKGGKVVNKAIGLKSEDDLKQMIDEALAG